MGGGVAVHQWEGRNMRNTLVCSLLAGVALAIALPAQAATFDQVNNGGLTNKIKAFSDATHPSTGIDVYGRTESGGHYVKFTGNTVLNITDGSGFAQISDYNTNDNIGWNSLTIAFDSYAYGFTGLEFSIQFHGKGSLELEAFFLDGSPSKTFSYSPINGNTGFLLEAEENEVFSKVVLKSGDNPFFQFKQAEIGIAPAPPPAVPEPTTWAMMIGGLGLAGAALRRRKTQVQFA